MDSYAGQSLKTINYLSPGEFDTSRTRRAVQLTSLEHSQPARFPETLQRCRLHRCRNLLLKGNGRAVLRSLPQCAHFIGVSTLLMPPDDAFALRRRASMAPGSSSGPSSLTESRRSPTPVRVSSSFHSHIAPLTTRVSRSERGMGRGGHAELECPRFHRRRDDPRLCRGRNRRHGQVHDPVPVASSARLRLHHGSCDHGAAVVSSE